MQVRVEPLVWMDAVTPPERRRSRYTFKAGWQDTLDLLERELRHLGAEDVIIEADFRPADLRLDGMPRSNARVPDFPGVRIRFDSRVGPLRYQTDTCVFWQHNVRSIALGLGALRKVDLYGITLNNEQYVGWKQLEAGPSGSGAMSREAALDLVVDIGEGREAEELASVVRRAKARAYPDVSGDRELWDRVQQAIGVLGY